MIIGFAVVSIVALLGWLGENIYAKSMREHMEARNCALRNENLMLRAEIDTLKNRIHASECHYVRLRDDEIDDLKAAHRAEIKELNLRIEMLNQEVIKKEHMLYQKWQNAEAK